MEFDPEKYQRLIAWWTTRKDYAGGLVDKQNKRRCGGSLHKGQMVPAANFSPKGKICRDCARYNKKQQKERNNELQ